MKRLIILAQRESYGMDDVRTMTVRELREALEEFDAFQTKQGNRPSCRDQEE